MKVNIIISFILWINFSINLQNLSAQNSYYNVIFDSYEQPIIMYNIEADQTVYKASKIFNQSVSSILSYNNIDSATEIEKGKSIAIPINFDFLFTGTSIKDFKDTEFTPLLYSVKPKDNLFRISKVYCKQPVEDMMRRNNLNTNDLDIGQKLIIGWVAIPKIAEKDVHSVNPLYDNNVMTKVEPTPLQQQNELKLEGEGIVIDSIKALTPNIERKQESGIAIWKKSSKGHSMFALHQKAKINSEIELYNPLVQRTVKAKVIGRIPKGAYNEDVSVIISPATAVSLGALDHRFKVTMTYEESL